MKLPHYEDFEKEYFTLASDCGLTYEEANRGCEVAWRAFGRIIQKINAENPGPGHNFRRDPEAGGC